jgi:hypothetical protein
MEQIIVPEHHAPTKTELLSRILKEKTVRGEFIPSYDVTWMENNSNELIDFYRTKYVIKNGLRVPISIVNVYWTDSTGKSIWEYIATKVPQTIRAFDDIRSVYYNQMGNVQGTIDYLNLNKWYKQ